METVLAALIAGVCGIITASLPGWMAVRRTKRLAAESVTRENFNAVVEGWQRLYDETRQQLLHVQSTLADAMHKLEACERRDFEKGVRISELERRLNQQSGDGR